MADERPVFPGYVPAPSDVAHARARGVELHEQGFEHLEPTESQKVVSDIIKEEAKRSASKRRDDNDGEDPESVGDAVNPAEDEDPEEDEEGDEDESA